MKFWKYCHPVLLIFIFLRSTLLSAQNVPVYERVYLSGRDASSAVYWDFKISEGRKKDQWTKILVPSNWEFQGFGNFNDVNNDAKSDLIAGDEFGEYKHTFLVPSSWRNKIINLVFDGASTEVAIWINGKSVTSTLNTGSYGFSYEVTSFLKYGSENLLEVKVSKRSINESINHEVDHSELLNFGGIFRPVYLEVNPENHFSKLIINSKASGGFTAWMTLDESFKSSEIQVDIVNEKGNRIDGFSTAVTSNEIELNHHFNNIQIWNPESPNLYSAVFTLKRNGKSIYEKTVKFGFRTVELSEKDGLYVNGTKVILKGVNRNAFYPTSGRALSEANNLEDILLIKEMNMNAVRSSSGNFEERFLELADSLGLFVIEEINEFEISSDSINRIKLIKNKIHKELNHPSLILMLRRNEAVRTFVNKETFEISDFQNNQLIYSSQYWNELENSQYPKNDFKPSLSLQSAKEFNSKTHLTGLNDNRRSVGFAKFWKSNTLDPLFSGGFFAKFSDHAVVRDDLGGKLYYNSNNIQLGILGAFREKKADFFTTKSIWSPIQLDEFMLDSDFNGQLLVSNHYLFSDLSTCKLDWEVGKIDSWKSEQILESGSVDLPALLPGEKQLISLHLPLLWKSGDLLRIRAIGIDGNEVYTWTQAIRQPKEGNNKYFSTDSRTTNLPIVVRESVVDLQVGVGEKVFIFSKKRGALEKVLVGRRTISLNQAISPEGIDNSFKEVKWKKLEDGSIQIKSSYDPYPKTLTWTVLKTGELKLETSSPNIQLDSISVFGFGFNYPKDKVKSARWIGDGPYRVWQNRREGVEFGQWQKKYNSTITGDDFENIVYPEFAGFHANFHALNLDTEEGSIVIKNFTPDIFLGLFKPDFPEHFVTGTKSVLPKSDLSFLYKISSIDNKFHLPNELEPSGQDGFDSKKSDFKALILYFDFY